jgi:hypothetical protein
LAFCLLFLGGKLALNATLGEALLTMRETQENTGKAAVFAGEKELRLAGFGPATYGLGNRCSIP